MDSLGARFSVRLYLMTPPIVGDVIRFRAGDTLFPVRVVACQRASDQPSGLTEIAPGELAALMAYEIELERVA